MVLVGTNRNASPSVWVRRISASVVKLASGVIPCAYE